MARKSVSVKLSKFFDADSPIRSKSGAILQFSTVFEHPDAKKNKDRTNKIKKRWFIRVFCAIFLKKSEISAWLYYLSVVGWTHMIKKETINNNMTIVRNIVYNQVTKMTKNIKEVIEVDDTLLKMIDINMKNQINKIINDYKVKIK